MKAGGYQRGTCYCGPTSPRGTVTNQNKHTNEGCQVTHEEEGMGGGGRCRCTVKLFAELTENGHNHHTALIRTYHHACPSTSDQPITKTSTQQGFVTSSNATDNDIGLIKETKTKNSQPVPERIGCLFIVKGKILKR